MMLVDVAPVSRATPVAVEDQAQGRRPVPPGGLTELARELPRPAPAEPFPPLDMLTAPEAGGPLRAVAPLVRRGCARLRAGIEALTRERGEVPFEPGSVEPLLLPS